MFESSVTKEQGKMVKATTASAKIINSGSSIAGNQPCLSEKIKKIIAEIATEREMANGKQFVIIITPMSGFQNCWHRRSRLPV
jgi:hypothetical protein